LVDLKHSDIRTIDNAFQSSPGYVLDFSNKTFREYFDDKFGIDIDDRKFSANGSSKMNRLRYQMMLTYLTAQADWADRFWGTTTDRTQIGEIQEMVAARGGAA
jgi:hypothetical protein